jgi:alkylation response protein AidB-like acyl-CoA dehydrogenase
MRPEPSASTEYPEKPGRHGAPVGPDERALALQRSIFRQRTSVEGKPGRAAQRRMESRDDDAQLRARIRGGGGHGSQVRRLAELAKIVSIEGRPAWEQEWVRQQLAQFIIECEAAHSTRLRSLTRQLRGLQPGPEGSMLKLFGSELGVRIARFSTELLGAYGLIGEPTDVVADSPRWLNRVLSSRQYTIAGGTSEIQRNIIGERTLSLPKG